MRALVLLSLSFAATAFAAEPGEEVELSSAPVTALSCAQKAVETGKLDLLTACPLEETLKGLVVFDVAEMTFYRMDKKGMRTSELERAYGGGSVDITGKVKSIDKKDKVPLVEVTEFRVTPKPKPGAFKGCL
ncbi:MAG: hypothetical protein Q8L48_22875 [Archangium sp.]|nr:hypothetical protein [Archangium sp.]